MGEEQCFFSNRTSKMLWYYTPFAVMLVVNWACCARVIWAIYAMRRDRVALGVQGRVFIVVIFCCRVFYPDVISDFCGWIMFRTTN